MRVQVACTLTPDAKKGNPRAAHAASPPAMSLQRPRVLSQRGVQHQGAESPDDLTSEVFLGVFRGIGSFRGDEAAFRSWLFTIAHRRLQDARRALSRRPAPQPIGTREPPPAGSAEVEALRSEAEARVRRLCDRLVPDQREVLLLRLVAGFTVDEVAAAVGKSPGAVKALQRRGLAALRKIISVEGVSL